MRAWPWVPVGLSWVAVLLAFPCGPAFAGPPGGTGIIDPGFEALETGPLPANGAHGAWDVRRVGRGEIRERLRVDCVDDGVRSGRRCLLLSIPGDTVGFEFVTVGQRLRLDAGAEYEASCWVRWADGPATPATASGDPSARACSIVSFWARHRDGKGSFAGRDVWLYDNAWHRLSFRFRAIEPDHPVFVYVSLLPNRKPVTTTVRLDDFELTALGVHTRTWYGPVDQVLEPAAGWTTYRFMHIPTRDGRWELYAQLNGWGNFGCAVDVSLDDFTCTPVP